MVVILVTINAENILKYGEIKSILLQQIQYFSLIPKQNASYRYIHVRLFQQWTKRLYIL